MGSNEPGLEVLSTQTVLSKMTKWLCQYSLYIIYSWFYANLKNPRKSNSTSSQHKLVHFNNFLLVCKQTTQVLRTTIYVFVFVHLTHISNQNPLKQFLLVNIRYVSPTRREWRSSTPFVKNLIQPCSAKNESGQKYWNLLHVGVALFSYWNTIEHTTC